MSDFSWKIIEELGYTPKDALRIITTWKTVDDLATNQQISPGQIIEMIMLAKGAATKESKSKDLCACGAVARVNGMCRPCNLDVKNATMPKCSVDGCDQRASYGFAGKCHKCYRKARHANSHNK